MTTTDKLQKPDPTCEIGDTSGCSASKADNSKDYVAILKMFSSAHGLANVVH